MVAYVVQQSGERYNGFVVFCGRCFWVEREFAGVDALRERDYAVDVRWVVRRVVAGHAGFHVGFHCGD